MITTSRTVLVLLSGSEPVSALVRSYWRARWQIISGQTRRCVSVEALLGELRGVEAG